MSDRPAAWWARIDRERRDALDRLMRKRPMSVAGVVSKLHDEGAAWITELGRDRGGITPDEVGELTLLIAETAVPNMAGLVRVGGLSLEQAIGAGVGAGAGVGLLVGVDVGRQVGRDELIAELQALPTRELASYLADLEAGVR